MPRFTRKREIPPPLELECLTALWQCGQGTVKDVRTLVTAERPLAYTTVMTLLDRLTRRGTVAKRKVGRSFLYTPLVSRESMRAVAVRQLVDTFFDGSAEALAAYAGAPPPPAAAGEDEAVPELAPALGPELEMEEPRRIADILL